MGLSVINWGGVVASNLSEESTYPLQTGVVTKELNRLDAMDAEIKALRATLSKYGLTKLSTANDVTDANAYALSATEKNPNISGSMGNLISTLQGWTRTYNGFRGYYVSDLYPEETYLLKKDCDTLKENCIALVYASAKNTPLNSYGIMITYGVGNTYYAQLIISANEVYTRMHIIDGSTWYGWRKLI